MPLVPMAQSLLTNESEASAFTFIDVKVFGSELYDYQLYT